MNELINIMLDSWRHRDTYRLERMRTNYTGDFKVLAGELLVSALNNETEVPSSAVDRIWHLTP